MTIKYTENQSEEFYRKLLLLDKLKTILSIDEKQCIFDKGYCWGILFKDKESPSLCYYYSINVLRGPFPEGEKYIARDMVYAYYYATVILKDRFIEGEEQITKHPLIQVYLRKFHLRIEYRYNKLVILPE